MARSGVRRRKHHHAAATALDFLGNCGRMVSLRPHRHAPFACKPMASPKRPLNDANKSSLLRSLPEPLSSALFKGATPVHLKASQVLFLAGDVGDGCYRVDDRLLKITMLSPSGSERILAFFGSGTIVGELSMIDGLPRSASVVAVRPVALSFISRAAFEIFGKNHPELYTHL